jgi:hypothetical protein
MKRQGLFLTILPVLMMLPAFSAADVVVPIDAVENNVNIRKSPEAGSDVVGRLPQGEWLTLTESVPGWNGVELPDGGTGYISADWTRVLVEAPAMSRQATLQVAADSASEAVGEKSAEAEPAAGTEDVVVDAMASVSADDTVPAVADEEAAGSQSAVASRHETGIDVPAVVTGLADGGIGEPLGASVETVGVSPAASEVVADTGALASDSPAKPETQEIVEAAVADSRATDVEDAEIPDQPMADAADDTVEKAPTELAEPASPDVGEPVAVEPRAITSPPASAVATNVEGTVDFLMKFTAPTIGGNSQIFDDGNFVGIGTTEPKQRLEVNGNIQINEQNSSVAGLMITQSGGETGYIMHNRASKLTIGAGSVDRITIDRDGNVGFGVNRPVNPIELPSGAHVTRGGVWTNSSSRARKENIHGLTAEEAMTTLQGLEPVQFNYRNDADEHYVGFIAEDVPDLVATSDREGLSAMDIVAVLTKVVQEQQKKIEALEARLDQR